MDAEEIGLINEFSENTGPVKYHLTAPIVGDMTAKN
jgi:hypothetical protein